MRPSLPENWRRLLRVGRSDIRRDIDAELRFHFETSIEALVARGSSPEDAHRQVMQDFGDDAPVRQALHRIDQDRMRRAHRREWIADGLQDLRFALRSLRRAPAFTLAVIGTLAIGIGATGTIGSLLDTLYLRTPAGIVEPGTLRRLWIVDPPSPNAPVSAGMRMSYPEARALRDAIPAGATIYNRRTAVPFEDTSGLSDIEAVHVEAGFFPFLGATPQRGRFFSADEDLPDGSAQVAVLSDAFWRRRFGADPSVVGREVRIDRQPYTVVGVAAPGFAGPDLEATDLWLPMARFPGVALGGVPWWDSRDWSGFVALARIDRGAETMVAERATASLRALARQDDSEDSLATVVSGPLQAARVPAAASAAQTIALRLAGVALAVLLITGANVVNLFLARAIQRERELGVRLALGVGRGRLLRLLLTESSLLAAGAGLLAVLVTLWGGSLLRTLLFPDLRWAAPAMQWRTILQIGALTFATGLMIGVIPASRAVTARFGRMLRDGGRTMTGGQGRLRRALIVAQTAFTVLLLTGAALFTRSLLKVQAIDLGYRAERIATASVRFPTPFEDDQTVPRMIALAAEFRAMPGVEGVARASHQVMMRGGFGIRWFSGADSMGSRAGFRPTLSVVTPDYFTVMGMPLRLGHGLTGHGSREVVVNEAMASALWPAGQALGRCIRLRAPDAPCHTVTGVVSQSKRSSVTERPLPQYFLDEGDEAASLDADILVLRVAPARMDQALRDVQRRMAEVFPTARVSARSLTSQMEPQYRPWRLGTMLFALFGAVALVVAAIGVYSNITCDIGQRRRELGIRAALGASPGTIRRQVVVGAMRPVMAGILLGVLLALAASRSLASLLYQVPAYDPASLTVVCMLLLGCALLATLRPAWRASAADPLTAIRSE